MFLRRLGSASAPDNLCPGGYSCPDVLELTSGDYAIIGRDITDVAADKLPPGSGCGPTERIVEIPRSVLIRARTDIPAAL